jgi:hypothetical protein
MSTIVVTYVRYVNGVIHLSRDEAKTLCGRKVTTYWQIEGTTDVGYLATCCQCARFYVGLRTKGG